MIYYLTCTNNCTGEERVLDTTPSEVKAKAMKKAYEEIDIDTNMEGVFNYSIHAWKE